MNRKFSSERHLIQHKTMPWTRRITKPEKPPCSF